MLELTLPSENTEGHWFDFKTRGATIRLKIRPLSFELAEKIEKKHTKHEFITDPSTRKMTKVPFINSAAALDEKIDHILEDFEGVRITEEGTGKEIPNTELRAKRTLLMMKQPEGERSVLDFVFETSQELCVSLNETKEAEIKNS